MFVNCLKNRQKSIIELINIAKKHYRIDKYR